MSSPLELDNSDVHIDSVKVSRNIKPGIPMTGDYGIPLRVETDVPRIFSVRGNMATEGVALNNGEECLFFTGPAMKIYQNCESNGITKLIEEYIIKE